MSNALNDLAKKVRNKYDVDERIQDNFEEGILNIFKEQLGIDERKYKAINFVSMLIYYCEKSIENVCKCSIKKGVITPLAGEMIDVVFDELTFTAKIKIYEKILKKDLKRYENLIKSISYYKELNEIRNKIFHCKLNKISYGGGSITKAETKVHLIEDMIKACGVKKDKNNISRRAIAVQAYKNKSYGCRRCT